MLTAWLLALQVAAAAPGFATAPLPPLVLKSGTRTATVPLVEAPAGPMLRPEQLAPVLPIAVRRTSEGRYVIAAGGAEVELAVGLAYAWVGDDVRQLLAAPELRAGQLYVPLQFVTEVLPYFARTGVLWDDERGELRVFSAPRSSQPGRRVGTAAGTVTRSRPAPAARAGRRAGRHTVVVDAGHGGPDRGMHGPIGGSFVISEKNITLDVAKRVGARLRANGVDVVYTRTRDTLIALSDRGRIANEANGDLFISIHVNAANPTWKSPEKSRGFETYFLAEAKTEDARRVEQMENESIRFDTNVESGKGDPLSFIINDMAQNEHLRESSELAELIQKGMAKVHPGLDRGVKQAGFRVLVTAFMPAVLVEIGFGTNQAEAEYLASPARQEELARAIAAAALEYLQRYDRRIAGGAR